MLLNAGADVQIQDNVSFQDNVDIVVSWEHVDITSLYFTTEKSNDHLIVLMDLSGASNIYKYVLMTMY